MKVLAHALGLGDIKNEYGLWSINLVVETRDGKVKEKPVFFLRKEDAQQVQKYFRTVQGFQNPLVFEV